MEPEDDDLTGVSVRAEDDQGRRIGGSGSSSSPNRVGTPPSAGNSSPEVLIATASHYWSIAADAASFAVRFGRPLRIA